MAAKRTSAKMPASAAALPPVPVGAGLVVYDGASGQVPVAVDEIRDTVWLSLDQIGQLFGRHKSTISRHLGAVFKGEELDREAVVAFFATTAADGKTYAVEYFNLDAILAVGYRVNSRQGTEFRRWASNVLRQHILRGYSVNDRRLEALKQTVRLVAGTLHRRELSGDEARALLQVVGEYSFALDVLDDYDHERLAPKLASSGPVLGIDRDEALRIVERLRERFGASALFGREKDESLSSALGAVMQSFDGQDVYPSLEDKAAHLLYFLTKNHPFVDGNKRIAAALFLWFLEKNGALVSAAGEPRVTETALVALTLLTASSRPEEKPLITGVIAQLLRGRQTAVTGRQPTEAEG